VDPNTPPWLRCPYDTRTLGADVITEARRSHPHLVGRDDRPSGTTYGGLAHIQRLFTGERDDPQAEPDVLALIPPAATPSDRASSGMRSEPG
jgi:hypothetical protein